MLNDVTFRANKKEEMRRAKALIDNMILQAEEEDTVARYEPELLEKAMTTDGFESPEAGNLPDEGKKMLAKVYSHCRKDGGDKEKCSKIAWSSVKNAGYKSENKLEIYKRLEKSLTALVKIIKSERIETIPEKMPQPSTVRVEVAIPKETGSVGNEVIQKYYDNENYAKQISQLLRDAPVETIPVDSLIATQDDLKPSVLREKEAEQDSRPIYVIRFKGKHYIYDGHHRVATAKLKGLQTIRAKVVRVDNKANPIMKALVFKNLRDLKAFISKAWQLKNGTWHDSVNGKVVEVPAPEDKEPKKQDDKKNEGGKDSKEEQENTGNKNGKKGGGHGLNLSLNTPDKKPHELTQKQWNDLPGTGHTRFLNGKVYTIRNNYQHARDDLKKWSYAYEHRNQRYFYRFTDNKDEHELKNPVSTNHLTGDKEKGLSTWYNQSYENQGEGIHKKKYVAVVSGNIAGLGSDGEPVLTDIKWELNPIPVDKLPKKYSHLEIREEKKESYPWENLDLSPFSEKSDIILKTHEDLIKDAIENGEDINPDILKDYPDLKESNPPVKSKVIKAIEEMREFIVNGKG